MKCPEHQHLNWADYTEGKIEMRRIQKKLQTCEHCLQLFIGCLENNLESPPSGLLIGSWSACRSTALSKKKKHVGLGMAPLMP